MNFSDNLHNLRTKRGFSQKKLANIAGVSQTAIYHWERGLRYPKIEQLKKLADALDVSVIDLVDIDTLCLHDEILTAIENEAIADHIPEETKSNGKTSPMTLAAHFDGDEYTEEELEEIRKFAEFVKSKRKDSN